MPHTLSTTFGDLLFLNDLFDEDIDELVKGLVGEEIFEALHEICMNPRFDSEFMKEEDALTKLLYEKDEEGLLIFPSVPGKKLKPIHSYLGDQSSEYHDEPSDEHSDFVAGRLVQIGNEIGINPKIAALIGFWHDVGKKYTAHTGPHGMSFYGHAALSAYIVMHWLKRVSLPITSDQKAAIVVAIYGHDIVKLGSRESKKCYHKHLELLDNDAVNSLNTQYCEALIQADSSIDVLADDYVEYTVTRFDPDSKENPYEYEHVTLSKEEYNDIIELGKTTMASFLPAPVVAA